MKTSSTRFSPNSPKLETFRNLHVDATMVVLGCGPSVKGFKNLCGCITIGVNDVGRVFQPTYLVVCDPPKYFKGDRFDYVRWSEAVHTFTCVPNLDEYMPPELVEQGRLVYWRVPKKRRKPELGVPTWEHLPAAENSPYVAISLAAYMGASRIGVIGVDHVPGAISGVADMSWGYLRDPKLSKVNDSYTKQAEYLREEHGIEVVNLSEVSRITAWPMTSEEKFCAGK